MPGWKAAVIFVMLALMPAPAIAGARVALVVGNSEYRQMLRPLKNPTRDAGVIALALRATGFDVELVTDADGPGLRGALDRFRKRIARAGGDATALFYYAGHGMQADGANYLAPVDTANLERDAVLTRTAIDSMRDGGAHLKIVILDACRNNPTRAGLLGISAGFRTIDALEQGGETFIAFSTAEGQTATDGDGDDSPYAAALAHQILVPGQLLSETFMGVRARVRAATQGQQTPWESTSVTIPFAFSAVRTKAAPGGPPLPPSPRPSLAPPGALQVYDFETVPTATAPQFTVAAQPYLQAGAVRILVRDVSPIGSEIVFINNRGLYAGNYVAPMLSQNILTQVNTGNGAASFTLALSRPARRVWFMIPCMFPATQSGVTAPAWKATALNAQGAEVAAVSRELARSFSADIPNQLISLESSGSEPIVAVRFESDPRLNMVPFAGSSALLIEGMWIEPMAG